MMNEKEVGRTKTVGYEIGVRKTIKCPLETTWNFLLSEDGIKIWIGKMDAKGIEIGQIYETDDHIKGLIRVIEAKSHIRMTWKKQEWKNSSILQMRVLGSKNGTVVAFHQEKLDDYSQREEMKSRWEKTLDKIEKKLI
jgi:activator of HSP90 ATPase